MKKNNTLSLLAACFAATLLLTSCNPDNGDEQGRAPKSFQTLGLSFNVGNQNSKPQASRASVAKESFIIGQWDTETGDALADSGDLTLTCEITDMAEPPTVATRGVPTGTTLDALIEGTRPVIAATTTDIETVFGTAGMGVSVYKKIGASGTPTLMTPNSEKAADLTNNEVNPFSNVKYTGTVADGWSAVPNIDGYYWYYNYKLRFFTYAPYEAGKAITCNPATGGISFSYTIPSADPTNQVDMILGSTDWTDRPEPDANGYMNVDLTVHHALSAIRFVVDNNYLKSDNTRRSKDFTINSITLKGLKNAGTCSFDGSDITWTPGTTTTPYVHTYNKSVSTSDHEVDLQPDQTAVYFAIPQNLTSDTKIEVNFTRAGVTKTITANLFGTGGSKSPLSYGSYLAGKMYTYVISSKDFSVYKFNFATGNITYAAGQTDARIFGVAVADQSNYSKGIANVIDIKSVEISWTQMTKHINKVDGADGVARIWAIAGNSLNADGTIASPVALTPTSVTIAKNGFSTTRTTDFTYYDQDFDMKSVISSLGTNKLHTYLKDNSSPQYGVSMTYNVAGYTYFQVRIHYSYTSTGSGSSGWDISNVTGSAVEFLE